LTGCALLQERAKNPVARSDAIDILNVNLEQPRPIFSDELPAKEKPMLHRKIYQLCTEGREVCIFLRDQQRWIESARIIALEGDLVTIRYETEEEDEICSWEEMIRLESIGAVSQKLASVSRMSSEIAVSDECPEAEQIYPRSTDSDQ
jgi:hypothetical protein